MNAQYLNDVIISIFITVTIIIIYCHSMQNSVIIGDTDDDADNVLIM